MLPSLDDKKYAQDTRLFQDVVIQDGWFKNFETSPLMDGVKVNEICIYGPNDLNKIGKVGKTSWDSFTYAIMMGHNVWLHLNSVQEANRQYDAGLCPSMLVQENFERVYFRDVVDAIFSCNDRDTANAVIESFSKFWIAIPGTRGATGKKTVNASTMFANLFDEVDSNPVQSEEGHSDEFTDEEAAVLDRLEESQHNGEA